jgi:glycosyltransferase involved in cell wall biosynthesis
MPAAPVKHPTVSVCMPAYNVERYIREAIDSVLNQTFKDFELIIIDDGSTDGTHAILEELDKKDTRIRIVTTANRGVSASANEAALMARGEFIARLDSDDVSPPDRLEKQVAFLRSHPDCVAVGGRVLLIDESGLPLYQMPEIQFGSARIDSELMAGGWPIVQSASMYRRDAVMAVGGYRGQFSLHEDHDLFLRLAEHGPLDNLPDVTLHYRRHVNSITFTQVSKSEGVLEQILRDAHVRRGLPVKESLVSPSRLPHEMNLLSRCRHWAWMSLKSRHLNTARKYAWAGFRQAPFSADSWKLMYCALRGR